MPNEQLKKFAEELKAAREEKGISIKDLHAHTRIDTKYLEALEEGNYSVMPEVYIRAFIKEYASEVDLDVEETLRKYELAKSGFNFHDFKEEKEDSQTSGNQQNQAFGDETPQKPPLEIPKQNKILILTSAAAVVIIVALYLIFSGGKNDEIIVENAYEVPKTENKINTLPKKQDLKEKVTQSTDMKALPVNPFKLKISGLDTVWVRAQIDNEKTEEFTLYPGISRTINVKSLANLLIGNSGGVEIYLDEKKLDFTGEKGKVKNLTLTKDGISKKKIKAE